MLFPSPDEDLDATEVEIERVSKYLFWAFLVVVAGTRLATNTGSLSLPDYSDFFRAVGMNPMNASGLAGTGFLFWCARPTRRAFAAILAAGLFLEAFYLLGMPANVPWHYRFLVAGPGLAAGGILGLTYLSIFGASKSAKRRARSMFRLAGVYLMYPMLGAPCFAILSKFTPMVYDAYGYAVEGCLGFWPCNQVAMFLNHHSELERLMVGVYTRLPVFVMIAFTLNLMYKERCYVNVFFTFILSGLVAWIFYPLLPMVGPDQYLGVPPYPSLDIPLEVPQKLVEAPANLPRTCFPSMHGTWILLPFFAVRRIHPAWNWFFGVVAFLTMLAALHVKVGHYVLDLVVSFPFAVAFMAVLARPTKQNKRIRRYIAGGCFGYVVLVALGIRYFSAILVAVPYLTWGVFLLGIVVSLWAESELAKLSLP